MQRKPSCFFGFSFTLCAVWQNNTTMRNYILALLIAATPLTVNKLHAQGAELGFLVGPSLYSGDISPQELGLYFGEIGLAGGAFARFHLNDALALRLGVNLAQISGDDNRIGRESRGLNFRTNITEFSLLGELNLFHFGPYKDRGAIPYLFGGAAVFRFNPQARFDGDYVDLQPLGTEGQGLPGYDPPYSLTQVAIPFGIGVKFLLNESLTLGLEFGGRKLFTDYLDDVSNTTINYYDVLEGNGPLAARLSNPNLTDPSPDRATYRRGGEFDDWYYIGGVSLAFRLQGGGGRGRGMGCPTW
jgi:hypothetical protein